MKESARIASGSLDLGISSNSERYVIQMRDSTSSRKATGQPPLSEFGISSYARLESKLLETDSVGVSNCCTFGAEAIGVEVEVEAGGLSPTSAALLL